MKTVEPMDTPGLLGLTLFHTQLNRKPFVVWNYDEEFFLSDVTYKEVVEHDPYYRCWTGFSLDFVLRNHYGWFTTINPEGTIFWVYRNQDFNIYIPPYSPEV